MTHDLDDINFGVQALFTAIISRFGPQMQLGELEALAACRDDVLAEMRKFLGDAGQSDNLLQLVRG